MPIGSATERASYHGRRLHLIWRAASNTSAAPSGYMCPSMISTPLLPTTSPPLHTACGPYSAVRDALHQAAQAEGCDFPGLGPHSFRRANITWRQQVGGSAIEASKIAGHSDLEMTGEYTFVAPERQNELTRRIQQKLAKAAKKKETQPIAPVPPQSGTPEISPILADAEPVTTVVQ